MMIKSRISPFSVYLDDFTWLSINNNNNNNQKEIIKKQF